MECVWEEIYYRADFMEDREMGQALQSEALLREAMLVYAQAYGWQAPEITIRDAHGLGTEARMMGIMPTQHYGILRLESRFYFRADYNLQAIIIAPTGLYPSKRAADFFGSIRFAPY